MNLSCVLPQEGVNPSAVFRCEQDGAPHGVGTQVILKNKGDTFEAR